MQARVGKEDGFEDAPRWVLTDGLAVGAPFVRRQYEPLKTYPGLFRQFAQLPLQDRNAILEFANEYGTLGIQRPLHWTAPEEPNRLLPVFGETWQDWAQQIDDMRRAVAIWDMLQARDLSQLLQHIRWHQAGSKECWVYDSHPDLDKSQIAPAPGRHRQLIEPVEDLFRPGDVLIPAMFLVQRWVNDHLDDTVAPRLLYDLDLGAQVLQIVPRNLAGAMWLQLAQTIAGNKHHRTCKECGKWFEVSSEEDGRTARRIFCSDPCKCRDYRRRKERAQQLKVEGKPVKDIAQELDTDAETVKRWLRKRKGK
jgi:hypothetical protein